MGWFNRKPRELIADSTREWETQRDAEQRDHDYDHLINTVSANLRGEGHPATVAPLIAAGGWCAPSMSEFLMLPEIQIKRGGIKWPQP